MQTKQVFDILQKSRNYTLLESKRGNMIVVDIQPSYHKYHDDITTRLIEYIDKNDFDILWFYNGHSMGLDTKNDVRAYLYEYGLDEEKLFDIQFEEKEYGFFRSLMDEGVEDHVIISLGRYMMKHHIRDSRDMDNKDFDNLMIDEYERKEIKEILRVDPFFIPDIEPNVIGRYNNCELIGGGRNECLEEIRLYMEMLRMRYHLNNRYIY